MTPADLHLVAFKNNKLDAPIRIEVLNFDMAGVIATSYINDDGEFVLEVEITEHETPDPDWESEYD